MDHKFCCCLFFMIFAGSSLFSQHLTVTPSLAFGVKGSTANVGAEISGLIYFDTSNFGFHSGYRIQHCGNAPTTENLRDLSSTSSVIFIQGIYFLSMMKIRPYIGSGISYYLATHILNNGNPELIDGAKPEKFDFENKLGFDFLMGMHTYLDRIVSLKIEIRYSIFQTKLTAELKNLYISAPIENYASKTNFNAFNFLIGLNINL